VSALAPYQLGVIPQIFTTADTSRADYYEREFKRVDCNHDLKMDAYEFGELHWNLSWCESPQRPSRPWWK
jgi:hypothetical protein